MVKHYLSLVRSFLVSLNKWQIVVVILAVGVIAWLLLQQTIFKPSCLNTMCPAHDPSLLPRIGFLLICSAIAIWLLKTPHTSE
jgi:hypothetical protein